jgi:hypothetical protein
MRRVVLTCSLLGSLAATSCSSSNPGGAPEGPLGTEQSAIAYGTADSAHTAVVALLANAGSGELSECSGTIVQVKNGQGYVLTAAHCCDDTVPSVVVMSSDYGVGEQYVGGATPQPPAYAVTAGSVYYDTQYDPTTTAPEGPTYDFCMLKFAAPAGAAVIPVAEPSDGVTLGEQVEHVGFGITDTSSNNSGRRTGTAPVNQRVDTWTLVSSQGGASKVQGVCEGDSGGPVLVPAGAAQSQQKVVGTVSYGNATTCAQNTLNVCMRVTSESGAGGFIANFLADTPSGTAAGSSSSASCDTCASSAQTGACKTQASACAGDPKCTTLDTCLQSCTTSACQTACQTTAGTTATGELNAFDDCVCNTACTSECASECGSSSSSSGGASCGLTTGMAACDACLNTSCCSQSTACAADSNCITCLQTNPICTTDPAASALATCLDSDCTAACGGSATGSSSSGSIVGSSSSGSAGAGGSAGTASGGAGGGAGTASGGTGASTSTHSSCSVSAGDETDPASAASLAGILLGAALAFSRRSPAKGSSKAAKKAG